MLPRSLAVGEVLILVVTLVLYSDKLIDRERVEETLVRRH
jgi:hypothetical protein